MAAAPNVITQALRPRSWAIVSDVTSRFGVTFAITPKPGAVVRHHRD